MRPSGKVGIHTTDTISTQKRSLIVFRKPPLKTMVSKSRRLALDQLILFLFLVVGFEQCQCFVAPPRPAANSLLPQQRQQQQSLGPLYIFQFDRVETKTATDENELLYVIERIGNRNANERLFREVAEVCINVFFKEQLSAKPEDRVPPWKEAQISYLKTLQTGDLKLRRKKYAQSNEMFLAYEVIPATSANVMGKPLILDTGNIYNLPRSETNEDFVRGRLLGFCEVTQRPYGLGNEGDEETYRPILTNLAVAADARKYGIGSKLVDECERKAALEWRMSEIVLEVEDYNDKALNFYEKRGYNVVFCDPASRRFDVGGLMLKKVRCTRRVLRKSLAQKRAQFAGQETSIPTFGFFQRFVPT